MMLFQLTEKKARIVPPSLCNFYNSPIADGLKKLAGAARTVHWRIVDLRPQFSLQPNQTQRLFRC